VIEAITLGPGATAALLGAGGGWLLAETTQSLRAWWLNRTARETAAKLVYAELGHNLAALSALREHGEWILASTPSRAAWEAHGAALVRGRRIEEVGTISMGYSAVDDVALLVADREFDFTQGDDADWLDQRMKVVAQALRQLGVLMGLTLEEIEDRLADEEATAGD
jgi:hypothetical protein